MENRSKSILIHGIVGVVVFMAALVFFNQFLSKDKGQKYSEMTNATFPVLTIRTEEGDYNAMSAYLDPVDLSLVRNQITVLEEDQTVQLALHNYNFDITAIQYELFQTEGEVLEEGTLNQLEDHSKENVRTGTITFSTLLEEGETYYLKMSVRLNRKTRVYFYTKLQNLENCHRKECMTFAMNFHESLFDAEAFQEYASYLEAAPDSRDNNYQNLNIHSRVDAISFGSMEVKKESEPMITIKEINDVYSVLQLDYVLSSEVKDGIVQYYNISENYKVRYTPDRMYLLDYHRTMDAYYNKALNNPAKNYVTLGIANPEQVDYRSSDKGYKVCFSQAGQLWYYHYNASDVAKVFSFSSENLGDLRNNRNNHDIKILDMDDDGNITYIVYGYMNRGRYEGKNGIQLLRYVASEKCNEEIAFFATSLPFHRMEKDVEKLAYLNEENTFYCYLDGDLHAVDLKTKQDEILYSGMVNENITASKSQSIIAVEENQDISQNKCIRLYDLETGKEQTIACGKKERIRSIGFLADDFIYGIATAENVKMTTGSVLNFPIETIRIVNIEGEEIKQYKKAGRYVMETSIEGSVLAMKFGKKVNGKFVMTNDKDYIRYKESEESDKVSLLYDYSTVYGNQLSIRFPNYVYIQLEPDLIMTKFLSREDSAEITLERSHEGRVQYYVYAEGQEQGTYDNLMTAIQKADEVRGSVINSLEKVMWECGFAEYAMVAGMDQVTKVRSDTRSLAGCLEMIAKVNGKQVKEKDIEIRSGKIAELLSEYSGADGYNVSGCTLDEMLYYVSKGIPVLAKYDDSRYVVVMSYNTSKVRYLDPVTGKSTAVERIGLADTFAKAGNKFYIYLP